MPNEALSKLRSQIKIGDPVLVARVEKCNTSSECCYLTADHRLAIVGESSYSKMAFVDLKSGTINLEDCKFSEETIFNTAIYGDAQIFFCWEKIFYVRPELKLAVQLNIHFQRLYCTSCVNYNRNVQQVQDMVYFVGEQRLLSHFSFKDPNILSVEPQTFARNVDTFDIARGRLFALDETGVITKYHLNSKEIIAQLDFRIRGVKGWFTCVRAIHQNYLVVCCLEESYSKLSNNQLYLLDQDLHVLDQTVLKSASIKKRRFLVNPSERKDICEPDPHSSQFHVQEDHIVLSEQLVQPAQHLRATPQATVTSDDTKCAQW